MGDQVNKCRNPRCDGSCTTGKVDVNDRKWYCDGCWRRFNDPLRAAWRRARLHPADAATMVKELLADGRDGEPLDVDDQARAHLLLGKLKYERLGQFDSALEHLQLASSSESSRLAAEFHSAKLTYCQFSYSLCWEICEGLARPCFPELFNSEAEPSVTPTKYHYAIVLLLCILSSLMPERHHWTGTIITHINTWLSDQHGHMEKLFDAGLRFSDLVTKLHPFPDPKTRTDRTVYALGDSHSLTLAWASLSCPGSQSTMVIPRLTIGLKAWHCNPALMRSREHHILLAHAASIPKDATVLMFAGEIDLRHDGPLFHSPRFRDRKFKYPSSVAGVQATIDAYVTGLLALHSTHGHRFVVYPVRPPPRTSPSAYCRGMPALWNAKLRAKLLEHSELVYAGDEAYTSLCQAPAEAQAELQKFTELTEASDLETELKAACKLTGLLLQPQFDLGDSTHLNRQFNAIAARALQVACPEMYTE